MNNSFKFFANKDCRYYPCHEGIEDLNCLFCYCPFYFLDECPGNPRFGESGGKTIKICTDCTYIHEADNYPDIIKRLKKEL
ncbi:MAG: cysteine-rich small domain-containing protein [Lachnospiraceae bacterium]|nr:cysteine-rich small domain-containing protein [Lachnospiraceae bacterium]